ncbi:MAG: hypothetical protein N2449_03490 [Bacteroidales bacterium]|nr:hypothetical protein [Bacteroidales bacterium]
MKHLLSLEKYFFTIISILFHPIFVPLYSLLFIFYVYSNYFIFNFKALTLFIALFFIVTIFLPALVFLLMYYLRIIKSLSFSTKQDRIAVSFFMFLFYLFFSLILKDIDLPKFIGLFIRALPFILLMLLFIQYFFHTISIHLYALGSMIGMIAFYKIYFNIMAPFSMIIFIVFATALTITARLISYSHNEKEVYMGAMLGMLFSFIMFLFVNYFFN